MRLVLRDVAIRLRQDSVHVIGKSKSAGVVPIQLIGIGGGIGLSGGIGLVGGVGKNGVRYIRQRLAGGHLRVSANRDTQPQVLPIKERCREGGGISQHGAEDAFADHDAFAFCPHQRALGGGIVNAQGHDVAAVRQGGAGIGVEQAPLVVQLGRGSDACGRCFSRRSDAHGQENGHAEQRADQHPKQFVGCTIAFHVFSPYRL